ncbi:hypothetical protein TNCV_3635141 [Trichonephila clavipes]|nr:hypothetical protein TNCV_3635141 [Trichonephila clavipes]
MFSARCIEYVHGLAVTHSCPSTQLDNFVLLVFYECANLCNWVDHNTLKTSEVARTLEKSANPVLGENPGAAEYPPCKEADAHFKSVEAQSPHFGVV